MRAQAVGEDIGADYVVEGSVRRSGNALRVSAQLAETACESHIWADRYDPSLESIFQLQDKITRTIAAAIEPELGGVERKRALHNPPGSADAWAWYQRGLWHMYQDTRTGNAEAARHFQEAIALEPAFAAAHAQLAFVMFQDIIAGYCEMSDDRIAAAVRVAEQMLALDERESLARMVLGCIRLLQCRHEDLIAELETTIALNPSYADAYRALGFSLIYAGRPEVPVPLFETAIGLSPAVAAQPEVGACFVERAVRYNRNAGHLQRYIEGLLLAGVPA